MLAVDRQTFQILLEPLPAAPALPPSMAVVKPGRSKVTMRAGRINDKIA